MNNCDIIKLNMYLDNELSAEEQCELEQHLSECASCTGLLAEYSAQSAAIQRDTGFPEGFHSVIMEHVRDNSIQNVAKRKGFFTLTQVANLGLIAAMLTLVVLVGVSGFDLWAPKQAPDTYGMLPQNIEAPRVDQPNTQPEGNAVAPTAPISEPTAPINDTPVAEPPESAKPSAKPRDTTPPSSESGNGVKTEDNKAKEPQDNSNGAAPMPRIATAQAGSTASIFAEVIAENPGRGGYVLYTGAEAPSDKVVSASLVKEYKDLGQGRFYFVTDNKAEDLQLLAQLMADEQYKEEVAQGVDFSVVNKDDPVVGIVIIVK